MGEITAFRPGMERGAEQKEVDTFIMSSLADFIAKNGGRPSGAIVLWIEEDGDLHLTWCNAEHRDFAYAAAHLLSEAIP